MADDIVTRLRDIAARCWCAEKSQGEPVGKPFFRCESCDDQLRAADEIERLRAAGDALAEALADMSCQNCNDRKCMDCVFRTPHDRCVDDCLDCVPQAGVHSPLTDRYQRRAAALTIWKEARRG